MTTYERLNNELKTARSERNGKPYANNTRIYRRGEAVALCLHWTDVVTAFEDGRVVLDSGGWRTVTTKERIHSAIAPWFLLQRKGAWFVSFGSPYADKAKAVIPYEDGMTLWPDGRYRYSDEDPEGELECEALLKAYKGEA